MSERELLQIYEKLDEMNKRHAAERADMRKLLEAVKKLDKDVQKLVELRGKKPLKGHRS